MLNDKKPDQVYVGREMSTPPSIKFCEQLIPLFFPDKNAQRDMNAHRLQVFAPAGSSPSTTSRIVIGDMIRACVITVVGKPIPPACQAS
jgi:hypothetical protein